MSLPKNPTKFVRLWAANKTNKELAETFGVTVATVSNWAYALRSEGVNLPERKLTREKFLNVAKLNRIIEASK